MVNTLLFFVVPCCNLLISSVFKWVGWGFANIYTSTFQVKWSVNIGSYRAGSTPDLCSKVSKFAHYQETNYSEW